MSVSLLTNTSALNAQRRLESSASALNRSFTRLSSGLRINRAGDDAAGLAVSSLLSADARVYRQAIRNLNDGLSYMNIAEGAAGELKTILFRIREISTQASNGAYSDSQRSALDVEVQELQNEYGRILQSTEFNGRQLLTGELEVTLQAGYGTNETLTLRLGSGTAENPNLAAGDGTFAAAVSYTSPGSAYRNIISVDINGDSKLDAVVSDFNHDAVYLFFGNGDGSFLASRSYAAGDGAHSASAVDINGDGKLDLITGSVTDDQVNVLLGNGDGSFQAKISFAGGSGPQSIVVQDLNGDGKSDVVSASFADDSVNVLFGNGNGTFLAKVAYAGGDSAQQLILSDINGDGKVDAITASFNDSRINVLLGNGNGTFLAKISSVTGTGTRALTGADFNGDGKIDIVSGATTADRVELFIGNGDGTFLAAVSFAAPNDPFSVIAADLNEDGKMDFVYTESGAAGVISVVIGNGNGTFLARTTNPVTQARVTTTGDFDSDGRLDLITASTGSVWSISILTANGTDSTDAGSSSGAPALSALAGISVSTQAAALSAQSIIDSYLDEVNGYVGSLGAFVSRIETATNALDIRKENFIAAASQIMDVDFAEESANLVRARILQQAGAAVLAQSNQLPALALDLLGGI